MESQQKNTLSIKDFQIIKDLGFGSFGKVQLIRRKSDRKLYAMKSILMSKVSQKQKDLALNQIRLLASISIPNVIEYKGSFYHSEEQSLCIIMQYADGGDLQHMIKQRTNKFQDGFDQKFIWKVAYQILSGLKTLHGHNIMHRDIKSANIFFTNNIAKLGDLNISKVADNGFCSTQAGTPYYTSPQIWKGQTYNNKCDIWSFGCIMYQLATLRPPFKANDFPTLFKNIVSGKYTQISDKYSQDLKIFIRMCLNVNVSQRPSAAQLLSTNILNGMQLCLQNFENQGKINLIDPIECPKVLRFLNSRLPQGKFQKSEKKKTVVFFKESDEGSRQPNQKLKFKNRVYRSQKVINVPFQDETNKSLMKSVSKKNIQLPPIQKNDTSKKSIQTTSKSKSTFKIKKNETIKSLKYIQGKQNKAIVC